MTLDRTTRILLLAAAAWSVALIVGAFSVPFYQGSVSSGTSTSTVVTGQPAGTAGPGERAGTTVAPEVTTVVHHTSSTLVGVNGARAVPIVSLPLLAVTVVAGALTARRRRGHTGAGPVAWTATGLVIVGSTLGILTVGPFLIPVAALVSVACVRANEPLGSGRTATGRAGPGTRPACGPG
jgi:hypothetical protein